MRSWLEKNDIEMYSTYNEGKSAVPEKIIRILKNNFFKYDFNIKNCLYS